MGAAQPATATEVEKGQTKVDAGLLPRDHCGYFWNQIIELCRLILGA